MIIEDFAGETLAIACPQSEFRVKISKAWFDPQHSLGLYADTAKDTTQRATSQESLGAIDQDYEHAALQAWCLMMNAYLEGAPIQHKSQLLKEWQTAEQRLVREKTSAAPSYGESI